MSATQYVQVNENLSKLYKYDTSYTTTSNFCQVHSHALANVYVHWEILNKTNVSANDDTNDDPSWEHSRKNNYVVCKTRH